MIMYLLIIGSAFFVYFNVGKHKIGKIPDEKGLFNNSTGMWTIGTLLLWIVFFPAYLIERSELITKAKEKPQTLLFKGLCRGVLGAAFVMVFLASSASDVSAANPSNNFLSSKVGSVYGDGLPFDVVFTVNEFINIGMKKESTKKWEKVSGDTWLLTVSLKDVMTGQVNNTKYLIKQDKNVAIIQRMLVNGIEVPKWEITDVLIRIWEYIEHLKQK